MTYKIVDSVEVDEFYKDSEHWLAKGYVCFIIGKKGQEKYYWEKIVKK